jgi:hypothetical protein
VTLPPFRPRSATELVDAAIQLARRHYAPLVTLSAIVAMPSLAIGLLALWLLPQPGGAQDPFAAAGSAGWVLLLSLASSCWMFVGLGALVASAAAAYVDGRALEPIEALRRALRRWGTLIGSGLLVSLILFAVFFVGFMAVAIAAGVIGAGLAATGASLQDGPTAALLGGIVIALALGGMVAGGLFALARFVNVTPAVMLDGLGATAALRRSNELVRGHTRRVAGVVGIMLVLFVTAYGTVLALAALVVQRFEVASNVAGVLAVAIYPFAAGLPTLVYYDLRIRREGYDLELMARALEGPPVADAPPPAPPTPPAGAPV